MKTGRIVEEERYKPLNKKRIVLAPPSHEPLFEKAVRECRKAPTPGVKNRLKRKKSKILDCLGRAYNYLSVILRKIYTSTPYVRELHPFYRALIEINVNIDEYKICLSQIASSEKIIAKIYRECRKKVMTAKEEKEVYLAKRSFFGRTLSVLKRASPCLKKLRKAQQVIIKLPEVELDAYTGVIAGAPNVGKSSLLKALTRAKPEIKPYPFTTKSIIVGHIISRNARVQLLDTPGLLDTPLSRKNRIERQAILAMRYLADIILFIVDPSEKCGFPIEYQKKVYDEIVGNFIDTPVVLIYNKIDVSSEEDILRARRLFGKEDFQVSALNNYNLDVLREYLLGEAEKKGSKSASPET